MIPSVYWTQITLNKRLSIYTGVPCTMKLVMIMYKVGSSWEKVFVQYEKDLKREKEERYGIYYVSFDEYKTNW